MKTYITMLLLLLFLAGSSQELNIIPQPVYSKSSTDVFNLSATTRLVYTDEGEKATAAFFNDYLTRYYGLTLQIMDHATSNAIYFNTLKFVKAPQNSEHYKLTVTPGNIHITGDSYAGTFYGMQTLIQLLPVKKGRVLAVPSSIIDDYPRFAYRGMHLDAARHFFPVSFVKKYIDYIALHKMNRFHWHLTDDQGWRIQVNKYPQLTAVGGCRNGTIIGHYPGEGNDSIRYCGFYTQQEIREVVDYAAKRYVTIIPEIEMPGHAEAALATFPWLGCPGTGPYKVEGTWGIFKDIYCAGNDSVFAFLQDVLDEVIELFPSKYIHIGGDESPRDNWKICAKCQARIKNLGLKNEHELQSYFIRRVEKYVNSKGRSIIGWDEILEGGLAPNATVMSWRGEQGGIAAARMDHDVIMTPGGYVYFDHSQFKNEDSVTIGGYTPLEKVYAYEPVPKDLDSSKAGFIMGAQANVWSEYLKNPAKVEYMIFPRISALSEVLWSPKQQRDWNTFKPRLGVQFRRYDLWKVNYSPRYPGLFK